MKGYARFRLISIMLLAVTNEVLAASSDASINYRLDQLERMSEARGQLLNKLQKDLNNIQYDIGQLRGQLESNQYKLNQAIERQKQLYLQLEELQKQTMPVANQSSGSTIMDPDGVNTNTPLANTDTKAAISPENEKRDYEQAIALVMKDKNYEQAIVAFRNYLTHYPDSKTYGANANFWLGQLLYNKGNKDDAAYYYAIVVKKYADSSKAPDALLKIGVIMQDKGEKAKAKAIYQRLLTQYPNTPAVELAEKRLKELK